MPDDFKKAIFDKSESFKSGDSVKKLEEDLKKPKSWDVLKSFVVHAKEKIDIKQSFDIDEKRKNYFVNFIMMM